MAFKNTSVMRFYLDAYNPGTATTQLNVRLGVLALDPTSITDPAETRIADIRSDQMSFAGLFDDGADGFDKAQAALLGSGAKVTSVYFGTATGDIAYCGQAHLLDAPQPISIKDLVRQEASFQPNVSFDRAGVLAVERAASGSGNTGSYNNTTASTAGGTWYVHVLSYTTAGTLTLQDSADGTSFATRLTYPVTTIGGTAIGTVGTIRQYRRLIESTGSFTYSAAVAPLHPDA